MYDCIFFLSTVFLTIILFNNDLHSSHYSASSSPPWQAEHVAIIVSWKLETGPRLCYYNESGYEGWWPGRGGGKCNAPWSLPHTSPVLHPGQAVAVQQYDEKCVLRSLYSSALQIQDEMHKIQSYNPNVNINTSVNSGCSHIQASKRENFSFEFSESSFCKQQLY